MDGVLDFVDGDQVHIEQELPGQETIDKRLKIVNACEGYDKELLVSLATSKGGLVDDDLRKVACSYHTSHFIFFKRQSDQAGIDIDCTCRAYTTWLRWS